MYSITRPSEARARYTRYVRGKRARLRLARFPLINTLPKYLTFLFFKTVPHCGFISRNGVRTHLLAKNTEALRISDCFGYLILDNQGSGKAHRLGHKAFFFLRLSSTLLTTLTLLEL